MRQPAAGSQCPQAELQEVEAQEEHEDDDVLLIFPPFPPKTDISLSVFFDLQTGQDTANFSWMDLNKTSNILLHFLHLNS